MLLRNCSGRAAEERWAVRDGARAPASLYHLSPAAGDQEVAVRPWMMFFKGGPE